MSIETDHGNNEQDFSAIAAFGDEQIDELTDILVDALSEAFRLLDEELKTDTYH